ncbi:hypothetical protein [Sanyastnella coralliicola]|uniref:hypothetical protein n=1 Tax=Sanyastnella coralliicola TaxID=3069118 RepID=UPI0027BACCE0|nr:hypothetical protein [Longitalea sp. SCSIO 12813]
MIRLLIIPALFFFAYGGTRPAALQETPMTFQDTIGVLVADSFVQRLGDVPAIQTRSKHYFKYIGESDSVFITKAMTNDPHFICGYPKGPLVKDSIYEFKICWYHKGREGLPFNKMMGFRLSNGDNVPWRFKGRVEEEEE